ncbi:MAG: winged helix-turn-helix transcriptional regulator [Alphaproteobacteria bacterium]|nr:winged helix-turn-helix transcriptional regulator [Alphaproteobacteria bacterium]HPF47681.1 metalloregulator ArsR/SmtB family transcription factor [Emcibacteraceae bacterium]HRW30388.1 metalloregulator ArsR/SmtB family transcription factor [Emcibacteraceae bacterium]
MGVFLENFRPKATEVCSLLKVMSHPNRLLILCALKDGELSVSELEETTGVRQPVLSRDLGRLRENNLVETRKESKAVIYRLVDEKVSYLMQAMCIAWNKGTMPHQSIRENEVSDQGSIHNVLSAQKRRGKRVKIQPDPYRSE